MSILRNFVVMIFLVLVVSFSFTSCHHDPGHTPTEPDSGCTGSEAAIWTNQPTERNGEVRVSWFPSSADPSVMYTDFATLPPFRNSYRGPLNEIRNGNVTRPGGNMLLRFCCGEDNVVRGQTHSVGAVSTFEFDGTSSSEIAPIGGVNLINVQAWVVLHCQPTFDNYENRPIDFPISVLTICKDSQDNEYELETTFMYQTAGSCKTWDN